MQSLVEGHQGLPVDESNSTRNNLISYRITPHPPTHPCRLWWRGTWGCLLMNQKYIIHLTHPPMQSLVEGHSGLLAEEVYDLHTGVAPLHVATKTGQVRCCPGFGVLLSMLIVAYGVRCCGHRALLWERLGGTAPAAAGCCCGVLGLAEARGRWVVHPLCSMSSQTFKA